MSKPRQKDFREAFEGRKEAEIEDIVGHLVTFLVYENALIAESELGEGGWYWLDVEAVKTLDAVHEHLYPRKTAKLPRLLLVNPVQ